MTRSLVILAAAAVLAVAGCGGGSNSTPNAGTNTTGAATTPTPTPTSTPTTAPAGGGGGETLKLSAPADGSLKFDKPKLTAKAGKVTIDFDNLSATPHAVAIEGGGVQESSSTVTSSKTSVTADLKPGTYTFFCPVDAHRAAGMEGTLTVK
jgi:plastocyanin